MCCETVDFVTPHNVSSHSDRASTTELTTQAYMARLKKTWEPHHQEAVDTELRRYCDVTTRIEKNMVLAIVLKYASKNNIPCNLLKHRNQMGLNTKKLCTSLRKINAGVISEGLCHEHVRKHVDKHGDTGTTRPVSIASHQETGKKEEPFLYTSDNYLQNVYHVLRRHEINFSNDAMEEVMSNKKLFETKLQNEGTLMSCVCAVYVVAKKNKLVKNTTHYCSMIRLTSPPTLNKMLKKIQS